MQMFKQAICDKLASYIETLQYLVKEKKGKLYEYELEIASQKIGNMKKKKKKKKNDIQKVTWGSEGKREIVIYIEGFKIYWTAIIACGRQKGATPQNYINSTHLKNEKEEGNCTQTLFNKNNNNI